MEIEIDGPRCIAAGMCVVAAPNVFDQDEDDGTVLLLTKELDPSEIQAVREAVLVCPASALTLHES